MAPLAWAPLAIMLLAGAWWLPERIFFGMPDRILFLSVTLYALSGALAALSLWRTAYTMVLWLGRLADRSGLFKLVTLLGLPVLWLMSWVMFGLIVPVLLAYGGLMILIFWRS